MLPLSELPSPSSFSLLPRDPFLNAQDTPPPPPPPAPQTHRQSPRPALKSRPTECPGRQALAGAVSGAPLLGEEDGAVPGPQASAAGEPERSKRGSGSREPTDRSPGLLAPAHGPLPHRADSAPCRPATPSARRHPRPLPPSPKAAFSCRSARLSPSSPHPGGSELLLQAPPRRPHPTPGSLQSRFLPSTATSRSKGPGPARNCDTEPQLAFPASLLLLYLWKGAKKLSPLAPGLNQADRTTRVETGRCWAFQGVSERGCPAEAREGRRPEGGGVGGGKKSLQQWMVWDRRR